MMMPAERGMHMGIIHATAWPSRYANEDLIESSALNERSELRDVMEDDSDVGMLYGSFYIQEKFKNPNMMQKEIACILADAMNTKPIYHKAFEAYAFERGYYTVGDWVVKGAFVQTECFPLANMGRVLVTIEALKAKGMSPDGSFSLFFKPERFDIGLIMNVYTIIEARRELLELALGFNEDIMIIVRDELELAFPMDTFCPLVIEACACLLHAVHKMAAETKKARMKPCDMSNPKYQMRSWLLRLGFIGEQFERPRQTLLASLEGNGAFFDEKGKDRARDKRRMQKALSMNTGRESL